MAIAKTMRTAAAIAGCRRCHCIVCSVSIDVHFQDRASCQHAAVAKASSNPCSSTTSFNAFVVGHEDVWLAEKEYDDCRMATTVRISRALTAQAALDMLVQSHSEIAISLRPAPFHDDIVAATRYIDDTLYIEILTCQCFWLLISQQRDVCRFCHAPLPRLGLLGFETGLVRCSLCSCKHGLMPGSIP